MFPILLILLCLVVLAVVIGPMALRRPWSDDRKSDFPPHKRALDVLDGRFAKGEIDKSEYDEKRRTIVQGR